MSLRELYQEMIIDHGKTPRNFGVLPAANHEQIGHNPLCGDQIKVYLIVKNDVIVDVKFDGKGCAISVASASIMTDIIKDKKITDVLTLFDAFHELVTTGVAHENLGKLAVFAGVFEFPIRVKCATLAWHTLKAALQHDKIIVSTE